jgi:hypothetical protein
LRQHETLGAQSADIGSSLLRVVWVWAILVAVLVLLSKVAVAATPSPEFTHEAKVSGTNCYHSIGAQYGISPLLLAGIAKVESGFRPKAMNRSHVLRTKSVDIGLTQVNSQNLHLLKRFGYVEQDLFDPCKNLNVGATVLSDLFTRKGVSWDAIGAYNAACTQLKGKDCERARSVYAWKVHRAMTDIAATYPGFAADDSVLVTPVSGDKDSKQPRLKTATLVGFERIKPAARRQSGDEPLVLVSEPTPDQVVRLARSDEDNAEDSDK